MKAYKKIGSTIAALKWKVIKRILSNCQYLNFPRLSFIENKLSKTYYNKNVHGLKIYFFTAILCKKVPNYKAKIRKNSNESTENEEIVDSYPAVKFEEVRLKNCRNVRT